MPQPTCLELQTGCRLHFGLMEVYPDALECYSGLGLMLSSPTMTLRLRGVRSLETEHSGITVDPPGPIIKRTQALLARWQELAPNSPLPERIEVTNPLPSHHGVGSGTQFACGLAAALHLLPNLQFEQPVNEWLDCTQLLFPQRETVNAQLQWLSQHAARGLRSAIGLRGFLSGGLILDRGLGINQPGRRSTSEVGNREFSTEVVYLPPWWRIVLIIPPSTKTVSGQHEETLIDRIARSPNPDRDKMMELALEIMQSSQKADFLSFCSALDHYMVQAGQLFSSVQGGSYTTPEVEAIVETAVASGLFGVGQSSWGPAVFGFAESPERAESAAQKLQAENQRRDARIFVTTSMPGPARVRFLNQPLDGGDKELESAS